MNDWPDEMPEIGKLIERKGDMSPVARLQLVREEDGDICIAVVTDPELRTTIGGDELQFCTMSGGGHSPNVLRALYHLAVAMEQDNQDYPL